MTTAEIIEDLKALGSESYKKVLINHGANEPVMGVKIADLKKLQKRLKGDHPLVLEVYDTGVYDAQYLAGLAADAGQMTKKNLRRWLAKANGMPLSGTIVAWVAAESRYGRELALEWIESKKEATAQAGWATLGSLVAVTDDARLDLAELTRLLERVERTIHQQPNYVRYTMNGFVIALGAYVKALTKRAIRAGKAVGPVSVDMGNTACEVPYAPEYIAKVQQRGTIGKKRRTARC